MLPVFRTSIPFIHPVAELSDEQVADQITTWAGRAAAGEARLLGLIAEFDRPRSVGRPGNALLRALAVLAGEHGIESRPRTGPGRHRR